jgi:hypothetical protein
MQNEGTQDESINKGDKYFKTYKPGWVNHLASWVNRLPGPIWSYYFALAVLLFSLQVLFLWVEGFFPPFSIDPAHIFIAVAIPYMLALIHYFDQLASRALTNMRPGLKTSDETFTQLDFQLTTLPAVPTLLSGLLGFSCIFLLESVTGEPYQLVALESTPISKILFRILYMILWWVFGTLLYHTIHQLRLIGHIYTQHTRINLFRMKDLYAFSNLIALTAGCIAVLPIGFILANPWVSWNEPAVFVTVLAVQIIALATFIWPHVGIHRLQVAEKDRLLDEANQRFESAIAILHQRVDSGKIEGSMDMNLTISSLQGELKTLGRIPTWPWQPETLRLLISALALPLGVWIIQLVLQRILPP